MGREAGFPYDVQWHDIDYMDAEKDFTTDPVHYALPDYRAFVDTLHDVGMRYITMLDPAIPSFMPAGTYPPFDRGIEASVFIKNESGDPLIGSVWPGLTAYPDWNNPNTSVWWSDLL